MNVPVSYQASVLLGVAKKYGIPINALLGIYGQETAFGTNVTTSSAGAVGPFQFIPSTAASFGYPLTNNPTPAQFAQQADSWGKYLIANNPSKSASGWAPAMKGGYTEAQAESTLSNIPSALKSAILSGAVSSSGVPGVNPGPATPQGAVGGAVKSAVGSITSGIGDVWTSAVADAKYAALVALLLIAGGYMILHGLSPSTAAKVRQAPGKALGAAVKGGAEE